MRSRLVSPFLQYVAERGGSHESVLSEYGLEDSAATEDETVMALSRFREFGHSAAEAAGDPDMGLNVARGLQMGTWTLVEYVARAAPTLRACLKRYQKYNQLLNEVVTVSLLEEGDTAILTHGISGVPGAIGRHGNECVMAWLMGQFQRHLDVSFKPTEVRFAHRAPANMSGLEAVFRTKAFVFDADINDMRFERRWLDVQLSSQDPVLLELLEQQAEEALSSHGEGQRFIGELRRRIRTHLADDGPPSLDALARSLRMSPRTLQRRIADHDTNLTDVVDDLRADLAKAWLQDDATPVAEVAFRLGYSDARSFRRAFKRWTGVTPSQFRRRDV